MISKPVSVFLFFFFFFFFFDLLATIGMNLHLGFLLRCVLFVLFVGYVVITF